MDREQAKQRIAKLKETVNHHRYLYHVQNRQEISDSALDSLKHELYQLEAAFPDLVTPDSPTQRVGGKPLEKFELNYLNSLNETVYLLKNETIDISNCAILFNDKLPLLCKSKSI